MTGNIKENIDEMKQESDMADQTLYEATNASILLLEYAAEQGKDVSQQHIKTIIHSKHALTSGEGLSEEEESTFWIAYRELCNAIKPVSRESLDATTAKPTRFLLFRKHKISEAKKAVRYYQIVTIVSIIILLVFQIYWVFVSTVVRDLKAIRDEIIKIDVLLFTKDAELKNIGGFEETEKERKIKLESEIKSAGNRMEELYPRYNANITLLKKANILGNFFYAEMIDTENSYYGPQNDPLLTQTGDISLDVLSLYLLPILYGLVGACAYILRKISNQVKERTFTTASKIRLQLRMVLGALAGLSIAWFAKGEGVTFLENITPLALAFLAGYSVELLFSAMDALIRAFSRESIPE